MKALLFAISLVVSLLLSTLSRSEDQPRKIRVASISFEPVKLDLNGNALKLESMFRKAAAGGAKIAVAPEGALDGYIVNEIIGEDISAEQMRDVAVSINSPTIQRFQTLAREIQTCLVFGFAERIENDVYNSAVFIDDRGNICGKYHKMQFHEGYDDSWWFNRLGKRSRAFDTPYGRCGVLICNDRWNPSLAKIPALDGAQFLVIPSFGSTSKAQDDAVLARGVENGLPIIEANVGVSLIVSNNKVSAVQRKIEGITFGEIDIPSNRPVNVRARDGVEQEFLRWREREMPDRLKNFLAGIDPRGPARDKDYEVIKSSQLEVTIGNNHFLGTGRDSHKAGYNGIFSIKSPKQSESPFVSAYAGVNLEHYFDAQSSQGNAFFEPRYSKMRMRDIDAKTVELYQPRTAAYQVESWTRFQVVDDYVDFSFRCIPHREEYAGGFLGVFWASYINSPLDKSMYFLDADSTLEKPMWRQLCTQQHNRDSTVRSATDSTELKFEGAGTLFANQSPLRYSVPFFYGRFRDMVLIYVFRPNENLRFTHSPSGGGLTVSQDDTNPAWDFQLIIPQPKTGQEYGLHGRLIYKRWIDRQDVLNRVSEYLAH